MTQLTPASLYRTIVVVDVAGFTDPDRNLPDRLAVRHGMYEVLKTAFAESDIDFDSCVREDRGDGALVLLPPDTAKSVVADRLPDRIVVARRYFDDTAGVNHFFPVLGCRLAAADRHDRTGAHGFIHRCGQPWG